MNKLIARRAVSSIQKEAKRDTILIAARALFSETSFSGVNMVDIAARAGLAKGTVYLYFKTKEEIFLNLAAEELEAWFDILDHKLLAAGRTLAIPEFVAGVIQTLEAQPLLRRLLPPLHLVFENNISHDQALRFKQTLARRSFYTSGLIEKSLGFLGEGQGLTVLVNMHCFLLGYGQMSQPSPVLKEILDRPEMAAFRVDLMAAIEHSLTVYLRGLEAIGNQE